MKFGIGMFPTDYAIGPAELGRACEERGFDSLYYPEHTHIPASRETPFPGGGELPRMYTRLLDPFVSLSAVAAVTEKLRLGFGVCLVVERDPIVTAKEVATLDFLSGGRVDFGVGAGWNVEEMANHGTDPDKRFRLQRERVEAMKEIWTQDDAEYHGQLVDFDPLWSWPKPAQKPHPPILIGNNGPNALKRVLRYGDGWMPPRFSWRRGARRRDSDAARAGARSGSRTHSGRAVRLRGGRRGGRGSRRCRRRLAHPHRSLAPAG